MAYQVGYFVLDDALAFLTEARALPSVLSSIARHCRSTRACILLSWVALEDGLETIIEGYQNGGYQLPTLPASLKGKLSTLLITLSKPPLQEIEFDKLRRVRNQLTHPKTQSSAPELTIEVAEQTFKFCLGLLRLVSPYERVCPFDDIPVPLDKFLSDRGLLKH